MKKLLYIEFKKFSFKNHIRNVLVANICMITLILIATFFNNISGELYGIPAIRTITIVDTFIKSVFIVWQSILIANLIVEEFRSKTILILFTYPINRKKLIISKLLIICIITLLSIVISHIIINFTLYQLNFIAPFIEYSITITDIAVIVITSITAIMLGMLPLYIGMINRSTVMTVASSILIVSLAVSSGGENGGLITMIPVSITMGLVGLAFAYAAIKKILVGDLAV